MDQTAIVVALISTTGAIVVGVLSYLGGRRKSVSDAAVARKLAETEQDKTSLEGWQALAQEYRADREQIREEVRAIRADLDETRRKVTWLEEARESDRRWKRLAAGYIADLLAFIHRHVDPTVPVPRPPAGLDLTDPDLHV